MDDAPGTANARRRQHGLEETLLQGDDFMAGEMAPTSSPTVRGPGGTSPRLPMARLDHELVDRSGIRTTEVVRVWLLGGFRVSVGSTTVDAHDWRLKKAAGLVKLLSATAICATEP